MSGVDPLNCLSPAQFFCSQTQSRDGMICHMIWYDMMWCDVIWCIIYDIWYDIRYELWYEIWYDIWYDMIWHDMIWYDMIWYGMVWYGMLLRYGMVWYGMTWHDITWHDMTWHDMIWYNPDNDYCNATYIRCRKTLVPVSIYSISCLKTLCVLFFFRENINMYLHFMSFLHTDRTQVVEIPPRVGQGSAYYTLSLSWMLMSWRHKEPGHQQPWYWPR